MPAILVAQRCSAPCLCTSNYCTIFLRVNSSLSSHSTRRHSKLGEKEEKQKERRKRRRTGERDSIKVSFESLTSETTIQSPIRTIAEPRAFWLINLISRTFQHATWTLSHAARQPLLTLYQPIELQPKPPTSIEHFNTCVSFDLVANRCNPVCGLLGPPVCSLAALCCLGPSCALRSQTSAIGPSSAAVNRLLSLRYS